MRWRLWRRTVQIYLAHVAVLLFLLWALLPIAVGKRRAAGDRPRVVLPARPDQALVGRPDAGLQPAAARYPADVRAVHGGVAAVARARVPPRLAGHRRRQRRLVAARPVRRRQADLRIHRRTVRAARSLRPDGCVLVSRLAGDVGGRIVGGDAQRRCRSGARRSARSRSLLAAAAIAVVIFLLAALGRPRAVGRAGLIAHALDKWHLGALRIVDFAALLVLVDRRAPARSRNGRNARCSQRSARFR